MSQYDDTETDEELEQRDSEGSPELSTVIEEAIGRALQATAVACPAVVASVDMPVGRCSAQPAVREHASDESEPVAPDVPILQLRTSRGYLTLPLGSGDAVLMVYADRSIDEFAAGGGRQAVEPNDPRTHDQSDGMAIPLAMGSGADAANVVLSAVAMLLLGGEAAAATHPAMLTDTFNLQHATVLGTIKAMCDALYNDPHIQAQLGDPAKTAIQGASNGIVAFLALAATWASTKVKVAQ